MYGSSCDKFEMCVFSPFMIFFCFSNLHSFGFQAAVDFTTYLFYIF